MTITMGDTVLWDGVLDWIKRSKWDEQAFISLLSDLGCNVTSFHSIMAYLLKQWAQINTFCLEKLTGVLRRYQKFKRPID